MCSAGAVSAAQSGRGNRFFADEALDYQVILPSLPTGASVANTVFLHGDLKARPYRVEDFRDALVHLGVLPEVIALGAFQMNHVWAVTFKSAEATKKMVGIGEVLVKEKRCLVVDPENQEVRIKLYWVLHNVPDEEVRSALAPYGKTSDIYKERWRVHGIADKGSSTRTVGLKLKPGVTLEDLPHQLRVAGIMALLVAPGRPPLCLRCHATGHIRRDCRVPRCAKCRRYGHDESVCVRTYANVAGVKASDELSTEHLMDEADAAETTPEADSSRTIGAANVSHVKQKAAVIIAEDTAIASTEAVETLAMGAPTSQHIAPDASVEQSPETTDVIMASTSSPAPKRLHEDGKEGHKTDQNATDEPPVKTTPHRRTTFKPAPKIPLEPRPERKPPAPPAT
ncbi:uncharacterized protein [Dermacentor albipictus]|uniref:uncharacterized protein n=1 Tax=Dermacentor albipictus TaxID=60249 RepID=UPI0038FC7676